MDMFCSVLHFAAKNLCIFLAGALGSFTLRSAKDSEFKAKALAGSTGKIRAERTPKSCDLHGCASVPKLLCGLDSRIKVHGAQSRYNSQRCQRSRLVGTP